MDLAELIAALSSAAAWPKPAPVEVRQTHMSVVFLVGDSAYKIRKPVDLGFVDFTTLDKRKWDCDEEVRLNRRLAPNVYRGVVPITRDNGSIRAGGSGEAIEWAVEMTRLADEATLSRRLAHGEITDERIELIARRIAAFHATAGRGERINEFGRFDVVAGNARENFNQTLEHVGRTVRRRVHAACRELTESLLDRHRELIESRARRGIPCDTHGDLHLSHVYLFPNRPDPDDLVIIDCIEFAERFRFADPVSDIAFLIMDLIFHNRRDLATACEKAYFSAANDAEGAVLLPLYVAYRAIVRAKVEGMQLAEREIPTEQRQRMLHKAEAHWLLALTVLEEPQRKPCLFLVSGLPGAGKSTLSRGLASLANFTVIRSDAIRKELAGVPLTLKAEGCYTPEWTDRTYAECLGRASDTLRNGGRAIVDASFAEEGRREEFLDAAGKLGVPAVLLVCRADSDVVRQRLHARRGDASDAGWAVYEEMASRWERMSEETERHAAEIDANDAERAVRSAMEALYRLELA
jgi:aminoglycoside phosphotransferase family enzyme/predicted kinase